MLSVVKKSRAVSRERETFQCGQERLPRFLQPIKYADSGAESIHTFLLVDRIPDKQPFVNREIIIASIRNLYGLSFLSLRIRLMESARPMAPMAPAAMSRGLGSLGIWTTAATKAARRTIQARA